jgi:hypothetical protein
MVLPRETWAATGAALHMLSLVARERSEVALLTPRRFRGEGDTVSQKAVVTDNFGNRDNRTKQPSARKVECGLLCPQRPGR